MSKNKYILPMKDLWYVEYGGIKKEFSHSWDIPSQRYAYDFEIRKENLPYHDDYKNKENFYSYNEDIISPLEGWVVDIENNYQDTKRYKDILLSNFIYKLTNEEQFGAITLDLDEDLRCISYEGTDNTLTGWKEDFEFSYKFPVPAQKDAIKYLNKVGKKAKKIILTGHSKGGNLALVAGMYSKFYIKNKIIKIYSNDGPGLRKEEATSANFKSIKDRYEKIIPKYSIFGLLFNDLKNEKVIDCNAIGILAHSVFTWKVDDKNLITAPLSKFSANLDNNFTKWSSQFNYKNREIFSNYLFEILVKNNIKTINDFIKIKPTDFQKILKEIQVDPKFKKSLMEFLTFLKTYYVGDINKKTDKLASKVINS